MESLLSHLVAAGWQTEYAPPNAAWTCDPGRVEQGDAMATLSCPLATHLRTVAEKTAGQSLSMTLSAWEPANEANAAHDPCVRDCPASNL